MLALVVLTFATSVPVRLDQLVARSGDLVGDPQAFARGLAWLGLSPRLFALYDVSLDALQLLGYAAMAALLQWRRPDDRLSALFSLALLTQPLSNIRAVDAMPAEPTLGPTILRVLVIFGLTSSVVALYIFPDGRFAISWTRPLAVIFVMLGIGWLFVPGSELDPSSAEFSTSLLGNVIVGSFYLSTVLAIIARYRRSSQVERQQTKWAVYGISVSIVGYLLFVLPPLVAPGMFLSERLLVIFVLVGRLLSVLALLCVPVSLAFSVLRYRLWEIDLLINRTLVYGALSASLAGFYVTGILLLQQVVVRLSAQDSGAAIVLTTLGTVALVRPLRSRLQQLIDRRFYRRRYDAAQAVDEFSAVARREVDLERLTSRLLATVHETVQPSRAWLWIRRRE